MLPYRAQPFGALVYRRRFFKIFSVMVRVRLWLFLNSEWPGFIPRRGESLLSEELPTFQVKALFFRVPQGKTFSG
jgi:hypothetical protein